ncbi:hypothetical protein MUK42_26338 [Musa troglodytarum]|uniref:Uncharacterized protein n=1 Tax=Musa troglodytarum TaxID=320322 RepID=A0A9E7HQA3_9LILI|nr:hypothetical protein MUK42_26338 [Musa troglodytarum]
MSFLLAIFAETTKVLLSTPIQAKDAVICKFPDDPSILLGTLSIVTLVLAAIAGHAAVYFPYKGKSIPRNALFRSTTLSTFFVIAEVITVLALVMLLWPTISESLHRSRNVHRDLTTQCPTAKRALRRWRLPRPRCRSFGWFARC